MEEELQIKRILVASRETTGGRIQRKKKNLLVSLREEKYRVDV